MSAGRISSERLERLAGELSDRDRQVVELLATLHLASGRQLLRVLWPEASESAARAARRELARLTRQRVVARLERRVGGLGRGSDAYTYALDVGGQRLVVASVEVVDEGVRHVFLDGVEISPGAAAAGR